MAPPPPAMLNGNLSNGIANNKPSNIITPPNHAGLLKEIETGNKSQILLLLFSYTTTSKPSMNKI